MIFRDPWEQKLTEEEVKYSPLVKYLQSADSVCFVGDSITEGTKNYGYGWYEPIAAHLKNVHCCRFAKGSKTSLYFLQNADKIAATKSNIYVMAYGTNNIRYRNPQICAMTADEYIFNTTQLIDRIRSTNPKASFIFIAPWTRDIDDKNCRLSNEEKYAMMREYALSLKNYCIKVGHWFIDPNPHIEKQIPNLHTGFKWLVDDIHPNGTTAFNYTAGPFFKLRSRIYLLTCCLHRIDESPPVIVHPACLASFPDYFSTSESFISVRFSASISSHCPEFDVPVNNA